jgi:hypothetical protein
MSSSIDLYRGCEGCERVDPDSRGIVEVREGVYECSGGSVDCLELKIYQFRQSVANFDLSEIEYPRPVSWEPNIVFD